MPGAVKIFADALTGGDMKELFSQMEDGKLKTEELIKVIDHLGTLSNKELLAKMKNTPARKLEAMKNQWILFLEETNEAGVLDVMIKVFEEVTDLLRVSARWIKANQKEFDALGSAVKEVYSIAKFAVQMLATLFVNIVEASVAFFSMFKDFFSEDIVGGLLKVIPLVGILTTLLYAFPPLAAAIAAAGARMWAAFIVPAAVIGAILLVDDLINALLGRESLIAGAAKEDGALGTLAATFLMIGETLSTIGKLFTSIFIEGDLQLAGLYVDEFFAKFRENFPKLFSVFDEMGMWVSSLFDNIAKRFGMMLGVAKATATLDFSKASELRATMDNMPLMPTYSQMNPSVYKNIPNMISNNPQQNITINAGNQSPEQIAMEIRKQWDSIASMSYTQSMTNYGALQ